MKIWVNTNGPPEMKTNRLTQKVALAVRMLTNQSRTIGFIGVPSSRAPFFCTRFLIGRPRPPTTYGVAVRMTSSDQTSVPGRLDAILEQKRDLRSRVKKELRSMSFELRSKEDNAIQSIILETPWFKSCKRLCAYISCSSLREVDTSTIISETLQTSAKDLESQKKLYVPRVEDKNSHMRMLNISSIDDLIANSMNILEPAPVDANAKEREDVMQAEDPVDLFLLPGLAFDKSGRRLGRGGGYYDTFLAKYQKLVEEREWKQPLLVALSYSLQILDDEVIPVTSNDVPVDALVSSSGITPISMTAMERMQ